MSPSITSRIGHEDWMHELMLRPGVPWWDAVPADFAEREEPFELSLSDRMLVGVSKILDEPVKTSAALLVAGLAVPMGFHPLRLRRMRRQAPVYIDAASSRDASRLFRAPQRGVEVREEPARGRTFRPKDGACVDLSFDSPYEPLHPDMAKGQRRNKRNAVAHARWWRHEGAPRPLLIAIHGFYADPHWFNEWLFALPRVYALGLDVLHVTLPYHGERQSRLSPFSGHGFFSRGISGIHEAFAQAVHDVRVFIDHLLHERGVPRVGVTGISLGGHTAALLAAAEPRLSFAVPNVPVTSLADLILEWGPLRGMSRAAMAALDTDVAGFRRLFAASCPLSYPPAIDRERLMVIGGVGDRLAPPKHSRLLWEHWGRCRLHWFPGSHLVHFDRSEYTRELRRFLDEIGFIDPGTAVEQEATSTGVWSAFVL